MSYADKRPFLQAQDGQEVSMQETAESTPTSGGRHPAQDKITKKLQLVQQAASELKGMSQGSARRNFGSRGGKSVNTIVHEAKLAAEDIGPLFEQWGEATTSNTPAAQFEKRQQDKMKAAFERALADLETASISALQREQNAAGPSFERAATQDVAGRGVAAQGGRAPAFGKAKARGGQNQNVFGDGQSHVYASGVERAEEGEDDLMQVTLEAAELDHREADINERHINIQQIQGDIRTIHALYQDLSTHVVDQGLELDNIESAMMNAAQRTEAANEQLQSASELQQDRTKWYCVAALIVLLIFLLALLAAVYGGH